MAIKQFFLILSALFMGYVCAYGLNIPIPPNVLGFIFLFFALLLNVIKLHHIEKVCNFIISYLALFFVVPTVGLMLHANLLKSQFLQILAPLMLSILIGYFVAAKVTEKCICWRERRKIMGEDQNSGGSQ